MISSMKRGEGCGVWGEGYILRIGGGSGGAYVGGYSGLGLEGRVFEGGFGCCCKRFVERGEEEGKYLSGDREGSSEEQ